MTHLTLINAYLKLKSRNLWKFVHRPAREPKHTEPGCLEFLTAKPEALRDNLLRRDDFTDPTPSLFVRNVNWESREKEADCQLHLKNLKGWPENRIHAHIDPSGFVWRNPLTAIRHWLDSKGYPDVYHISQKLASRGMRLGLI